MNIIEKVALAICEDLWAKGMIDMELPPKHFLIPATLTARAAVEAFLEAAAEQGWHMRPDEATKEMILNGDEAHWKTHEDGTQMKIRPETNIVYRTMLAAAPKFEWDK